MYKIRIEDKLVETLQIERKGKTLDINVDMNITEKMNSYIKAERKFNVVISNIRSGKKVEVTEIGEAVLALFEITFGSEQTKKIIEFVDGDYVSLMTQLIPFFNEVVSPAFNKAREKNISRIKKNFKTRRFFS